MGETTEHKQRHPCQMCGREHVGTLCHEAPIETVEHAEDESPKQREEREELEGEIIRIICEAVVEDRGLTSRHRTLGHYADRAAAKIMELLRTHSPEEPTSVCPRCGHGLEPVAYPTPEKDGWCYRCEKPVPRSPEEPFPVEHGEDDVVETVARHLLNAVIEDRSFGSDRPKISVARYRQHAKDLLARLRRSADSKRMSRGETALQESENHGVAGNHPGEDDIVERWEAAVEAYQRQNVGDRWDFVKLGNLLKRELVRLRRSAPREVVGERVIHGSAFKDGDKFCPERRCDTHQESWVFVPFCMHDREVDDDSVPARLTVGPPIGDES